MKIEHDLWIYSRQSDRRITIIPLKIEFNGVEVVEVAEYLGNHLAQSWIRARTESESTSRLPRIVTTYSRCAENRVNGLTSGMFGADIVFVSVHLYAAKKITKYENGS